MRIRAGGSNIDASHRVHGSVEGSSRPGRAGGGGKEGAIKQGRTNTVKREWNTAKKWWVGMGWQWTGPKAGVGSIERLSRSRCRQTAAAPYLDGGSRLGGSRGIGGRPAPGAGVNLRVSVHQVQTA